jgi:filamentous hemagglutinin family protein
MKISRLFAAPYIAGIGFSLTNIALQPGTVQAQSIAADSSLNTIVTSSNGKDFTIQAGSKAGPNLFHSFGDFSIPTGGSANFDLIATPTISTIFSRVTGRNISTIDGIIFSQNSTGPINLFILNPNGLILGPNARLAVSGSVIASTASAVSFGDGQDFNRDTPTSALSITTPIGLQLGQNPGSIVLQGTGYPLGDSQFLGFSPTTITGPIDLQGPTGQTLALVGQGIRFENASLGIEGGNLELGSVGAGASVSLLANDQGFQLGYAPETPLADLSLTGRSLLSLGGAQTSRLNLVGNQVRIADGAMILSQNQGNSPAEPIQIQADRLDIISSDRLTGLRSGISSETFGGEGAPIQLKIGELRVDSGGGILSKNVGLAPSGTVDIQASRRIEVNGFAPENPLLTSNIGSLTLGAGTPGMVQISAPVIDVTEGGGIVSTTFQQGSAASLLILSDRLSISGATSFRSPSTVSSTSFGTGNSGDVTLQTRSLLITGGGDLGTSSHNQGNAGQVKINATDYIEISGQSEGGASSISSSLRAIESPLYRQLLGLPEVPTGMAGGVTIQTPKLTLSQGGKIYAGNEGNGDAGILSLQIDRLILSNGSIEAKTLNGQGGNLSINSKQSIVIQNNSLISASAGTLGNGGNIKINSPFVLGLGNSDIIANAIVGRGGNISLATQGLFGFKYRNQLTPENDINANSEFGISGIIQINNLDANFNTGIVEMPTTLVYKTPPIASCNASQNSQLVLTGNGGLPANPITYATAIQPWSDRRDSNTEARSSASQQTRTIINASTWAKTSQGKIELIAQDGSNSFPPSLSPCQTPNSPLKSAIIKSPIQIKDSITEKPVLLKP